jgi:hypothetical protein
VLQTLYMFHREINGFYRFCPAVETRTEERYEVHHGVRITDGAIVAAATLSNRYIGDRFLPDKAIDLIDEASRLRIEIDSMPQEIDEGERRITQLVVLSRVARVVFGAWDEKAGMAGSVGICCGIRDSTIVPKCNPACSQQNARRCSLNSSRGDALNRCDRSRCNSRCFVNRARLTFVTPGQVAEWLKAPVSKTGIPVTPVSRVRISPCP